MQTAHLLFSFQGRPGPKGEMVRPAHPNPKLSLKGRGWGGCGRTGPPGLINPTQPREGLPQGHSPAGYHASHLFGTGRRGGQGASPPEE